MGILDDALQYGKGLRSKFVSGDAGTVPVAPGEPKPQPAAPSTPDPTLRQAPAAPAAPSTTPLSASEQSLVGKPNPGYLDGSKPGWSSQAAEYIASKNAMAGPPVPPGGVQPDPISLRPQVGGWKGGLGAAGVGVGGALQAAQAYQQSGALDDGADRAALAGEHVGRFASSVLGAQGGAMLGAMTGPLAPVASPALGLAGGVAGYYAPDLVKKATDAIGLTDKSTQLPSDKANDILAARAAARPAVTAPSLARPDNGPAVDPVDQEFNDRMKKIGVTDITSTTDENGLRTIGNTRPASATAQAAQAANDRQRTLDSQGATQRYNDQLDKDTDANRQAQIAAASAPRDNTVSYGRVSQFTPDGASGPTGALDSQIADARAGNRIVEMKALMDAKNDMMRDATTRAGQQDQLQASLRSSQVADRGHTIGGENARLGLHGTLANAQATRDITLYNARRDQSNKDREFIQSDAKISQDQKLAAESHASKALESIAPRITNEKGENVADPAFVQSRMADLTHTLGKMAADLPPEKAQMLREKGFAALAPDAQAQLLQAAAMKQRVEETRGIAPGNSDGPVSQDLREYAPVGDDSKTSLLYNTTKLAGGQTIRTANATHKNATALFNPGFGNPVTDDFGVRRR